MDDPSDRNEPIHPAPVAHFHDRVDLPTDPVKSASPFVRQLQASEESLREHPNNPHRLAREVMRQRAMLDGNPIWRKWNGQVFRWEDWRYKPMSGDLLRSLITGALKDIFDARVESGMDQRAVAVTPTLANQVENALGSMIVVESEEIPVWLGDEPLDGEVFAFRNALLRIDGSSGSTLGSGPPDPRWFSRVRFPYEYRSEATCPRWRAFVAQVLPDVDDQRLLQEMFGYCLVPDTTMQKFFLLEGRGSNGKSVTTNVLTELLGADNVSSVALEEFGDSFGLETTIGKLANIVSEINDPSRLPEGIIKKVVSGERLTVNRKHLQALQIKPTARLVVTTNEMPQFKDQSNGMSRRLVPLRFRVSIPENEQDTHLLDALCLELPGIFLWAVEGLTRLRRRGQFELPESSRAMLEEMRPALSSPQQFLQVCCEANDGGWVPTDALYAAYEQWCGDLGHRPEARSKFCQKIGWEFPGAKQQREGSGERRYRYAGIRLKPTAYGANAA